MTPERNAMNRAQAALRELKKELRNIQDINTENGNLRAANAAMGALGRLIAWHSDVTKDLYEHWPEQAGDIQVQGGGR